MTTGFQLSRVLLGHEQDVKALTSNAQGSLLVSGSRDASVRVWPLGSSLEPHAYRAHSHFVNSVAFLSPSPEHPNGMASLPELLPSAYTHTKNTRPRGQWVV